MYTRLAEELVVHGPDLLRARLAAILPSLEVLAMYNANDAAFDTVRQAATRISTMLQDESTRQKAKQDSLLIYSTNTKDQLAHSTLSHRKPLDLLHVAQGNFESIGDASPVTPSKRRSVDMSSTKIGLSSPPKKMSCDFSASLDAKESLTESLGTTPLKSKALKFKKIEEEDHKPVNLVSAESLTKAQDSQKMSLVLETSVLDLSKEPQMMPATAAGSPDMRQTSSEVDEFGDFQENSTSPKPTQ